MFELLIVNPYAHDDIEYVPLTDEQAEAHLSTDDMERLRKHPYAQISVTAGVIRYVPQQ